jgi:outer membrane protein
MGMKKKLIFLGLFLCSMFAVQAQKFALIDMEYLLKNIPAYETANEQLSQVSKKWQSEVDNGQTEIQNMYKNYQTEAVFLSDDMKTKRENDIVQAEKNLQELRRKYFGPDGELFKRRESLIKPIQDEIYNAVKDLCDEKGYQLILDRASGSNIIFASPKIDVSDEVLAKLGYSK